ncbi:MAG: peptidylprolyl isomerase [Candidatus ainarchaeum sp.]|nr:peptidylprolyl isomerase [Candidatus ainarchaeum sp.]
MINSKIIINYSKIIIILFCFSLIFGCTSLGKQSSEGGLEMADHMNDINNINKVKNGDNISVHYTGRLENGHIFDSSVGRKTLDFTVGAGQMIKGFDEAVIDMKVGDKKTVTLLPQKAYGDIDDSRIVVVDSNSFKDFSNLVTGMMVSGGNGISGKIIEKNDKNATIDFNHELAGKTLIFDIELISIN